MVLKKYNCVSYSHIIFVFKYILQIFYSISFEQLSGNWIELDIPITIISIKKQMYCYIKINIIHVTAWIYNSYSLIRCCSIGQYSIIWHFCTSVFLLVLFIRYTGWLNFYHLFKNHAWSLQGWQIQWKIKKKEKTEIFGRGKKYCNVVYTIKINWIVYCWKEAIAIF